MTTTRVPKPTRRRDRDGCLVINGAICVGGTWEVDVDVTGQITGHRYVTGSEPTPPTPAREHQGGHR